LIVIIDGFLVHVNLGEHQKAINDYDQAITLDPNDAISFANRGFDHQKIWHCLG
jgi:tetratricopeptide (TPR) repeat protein